MSSYLVYICQAVRDRTGLERYWREPPAAYPKNNVDVLAAYGPCEVLEADQEERVGGSCDSRVPSLEQTVEWFNGDAYVVWILQLVHRGSDGEDFDKTRV